MKKTGKKLLLDVISAEEAGAAGGELEGLDGEGEVLVTGVVDQEAVDDGLLQTLGAVAVGHQRTRPVALALLQAGRLGKHFIVHLQFKHVREFNPIHS